MSGVCGQSRGAPNPVETPGRQATGGQNPALGDPEEMGKVSPCATGEEEQEALSSPFFPQHLLCPPNSVMGLSAPRLGHLQCLQRHFYNFFTVQILIYTSVQKKKKKLFFGGVFIFVDSIYEDFSVCPTHSLLA